MKLRLRVMLVAFAAQTVEEALFLPIRSALTAPGFAPGQHQFTLAVTLRTILAAVSCSARDAMA